MPAHDTSLPSLSVVIPVYNEEGSIPPLWAALEPVLRATGVAWEVLFVDDGSKDKSLDLLRGLRARDSRVRVFSQTPNRGQSKAFWVGFQAARAPVVVTLDADLQNDPRDLPLLLAAIKPDAITQADLAIGWRHQRNDPFLKRISSKIANGFRNWVTDEEVHDVGCSLKAFRREVFAHFYPFRGMHRFFPTLARIAGFRVVEVKVSHHPRTRGVSKYGVWNRLVGPLLDCLAVRWMKKRYVGRVDAKEIDGPLH